MGTKIISARGLEYSMHTEREMDTCFVYTMDFMCKCMKNGKRSRNPQSRHLLAKIELLRVRIGIEEYAFSLLSSLRSSFFLICVRRTQIS